VIEFVMCLITRERSNSLASRLVSPCKTLFLSFHRAMVELMIP